MPDVGPVALVTSSAHPGGGSSDADLVAALADAGVEARWVAWDDDAVDWAGFVLAVVRSAQDRTGRVDELLAWVDRAGVETELWNPPALLRWNSHRGYLLELAQRGVPVVPTMLVRAWEACPDLGRLVQANGWEAFVLKPAAGLGGAGPTRWTSVDVASAAAELERLHAAGDVLVQRFVPEVVDVGETSVAFLGGRVSHAVRRQPAPGEFRVQAHHGGVATPVPPLPDEIRLGRQVLGALELPTLYARVDCVAVAGAPVLLALEVLAPDLFCDLDELAPARFAAAVAAHLAVDRA